MMFTRTLAQAVYLDSSLDVVQDLPRAGSALEHPYVFDAAAREFKQMADQGMVEIVSEHAMRSGEDVLIDKLRFRRVR